ncbi:MAG: ATP synthase F1 subunit epsilon [Candidatus Kerfeldbacteria bacterium]|nr:ATP synthase F1 subunit epsilon [Candidatus Kerfeldbacteria bacterium]
MMKTFKLEITTPEHVVYRDEATSVTLPTVNGEITVLANHLPVVTVLTAGELVIRKDGTESPYAVSGGFAKVDGQKLSILADTAERFDEIDEQRAEEARQRVEQLRQSVAADDTQYAQLAGKIERELARLHVVRKHKHRGHVGITQEGVRRE